jgi:hypothetical protein
MTNQTLININRIIRSRRRTVALIVERDGTVTVRAPMKLSMKVIMEFAEKHSLWIARKQEEVKAIIPEQARQYQPGERFLFLGQTYPLEFVKNGKKRLVLEDGFKLVESEAKNAEAALHAWYCIQAREITERRVKFFAELYQLRVGKICITSARTRWGSCSSKSTLSFSWRLVMTPPDVIDYVIVHELAHMIHHNHSKRFWDLVEQWMPDYKDRRKRLRSFGRESI